MLVNADIWLGFHIIEWSSATGSKLFQMLTNIRAVQLIMQRLCFCFDFAEGINYKISELDNLVKETA